MNNNHEIFMFEQPKRHNLGPTLLREVSIGPIDSSLSKRAEWMIGALKVKDYLSHKMERNERGEVTKGVTVLSVGSGKGHELEELDMHLPKSRIIGVDPHDHMTRPVERRLKEQAHDCCYLDETYSAENLSVIKDKSIDGIVYCFVLHHIIEEKHDLVVNELNRVIKDDGYVFLAEDLVDNTEEHKKTERVDRLLNVEVRQNDVHNYRNIEDWKSFFNEHGFNFVDANEEKSKSGVRHGFFVFQKRTNEALKEI